MWSRLRRDKRGIALITVLLIFVIMLILIGALLNWMPVELNQSSYVGYDNRSLYAADAGVQFAIEQISSDYNEGVEPTAAPTPGNTPFASFYLEPSPSPSASPDVQVWIQAVGAGSGPAVYYVRSIGTFDNIPHRVDAVIQQEPLNGNLLFGKDNGAGNYFVGGLMYFDGPVYLQGNSNPVNIEWYNNNPPTPVFAMGAQIAGSYTIWKASSQATPPPTQWNEIDALGLGGNGLQLGGAVQTYPVLTNSASVANEAYNGNTTPTTFPSPGANGVYMNGASALSPSGPSCNGHTEVTSGIYVQGDADIAMSSTSSTQTFTLTPPSNDVSGQFSADTWTVQINFTADTTTVTETGSTTSATQTYCGTPSGDPSSQDSANGVLFVDGNVDSLSGTVHGDYTIAVPDDATSGSGADNVILTGNIEMQNDPDPNNATYCNCTSPDELGIYANNVEVSQTIPGAAQFEAAIFAGNSAEQNPSLQSGSYEVKGNITGGAKGVLNVYGSVVQNYIEPLGIFNQASGKLVSGWQDTYNWDQRFLTQPPPGMPESSKYNIIAWQDVGTP